jgi:hypothetical protein
VKEAALKEAETFAQKTLDAAAELGLPEAAARMDKRLLDLLGVSEDDGPLLEVVETGMFSRRAQRISGVDGQGAGIAARAFSLPDGEPSLVTVGAPDYRCYVLEVAGRKAASAEEFAESNPMMRAFYIGDKQQRILAEWMDGLLAAAERDPRSLALQESESEPEE